MTRAAPPERAAFSAFRAMPTRWADNDAYGHLNNATYYSLFDTAVSLWQMDRGIVIDGPGATRLLVVENGCTYFSEVGFPDILHAGLRLAHLGRTSFRTDIALFRNDAPNAAALGFFTQVHVDATGRPSPLPDTLRARLGHLTI